MLVVPERFLPILGLALVGAICVAVSNLAAAHPGGLNKDGCHTNRKTGEYHCHRNGMENGQGFVRSLRKSKGKENCVPLQDRCTGCGCKGGPGYRSLRTGECVGYKLLASECGNPPAADRCIFENAPGTGANRECALGQ
jgi:hypothetical protein